MCMLISLPWDSAHLSNTRLQSRSSTLRLGRCFIQIFGLNECIIIAHLFFTQAL